MKKTIGIFQIILAVCLSVCATSALAQTSTTGVIEGVVTDVTGAVVPGATVRVSSPNLMRSQTATTDSAGNYRIPNLPPGRYTVSIEPVSGFAKFEQANIEVNLSKTSTVDARLQPQGASATVEVTASSGAAIDVTTNTSGTNVTTDQFSNFPTQRTVQSLYTIAPTSARSGLRDASGRDRDPSVAGSSGPENNYILDGVTTSDPAFGGSGANLPFEFVQEVEIKTGAFGAEYGKSTGGIFNVITKSGTNEFHGDAYGYFTTKGMVRETKKFPFTGVAPNGFSEVDAGFGFGGPIIKDKLTFFGAFNPQRRENFFLTQTLREPVKSKVTTPFYAGKVSYAVNQLHTLTFSTFGDFTRQEGFLFRGLPNDINGFGADPNSFLGVQETGGQNYTVRLNSTFTPKFIGEFAFGLHLQRFNMFPDQSVVDVPYTLDNFAVLRADNTIAPITVSNVNFTQTANNVTYNLGPVAYVKAPGGSLQRNFLRQGFAPFFDQVQDRNRWEIQARLQNIVGRHTFKYGFEYTRNTYDIDQQSTGPNVTFANPQNLTLTNGPGVNQVNGFRVNQSFGVCTTRSNQIVCPSASLTSRAALIATQAGYPGGAVTDTLTLNEVNNNPFLVRTSTRVRGFALVAQTHTNVQGFYLQDNFQITRNVLLNGGLRWDFQQSFGNEGPYLKFNKFKDNLQPRVGITWDFTGQGRGKVFANYAKFIETPIPLDVNVRAGSNTSQTDKQFNVDLINAAPGSVIVPGFRTDLSVGGSNLGSTATPIDPDLKPQSVYEATAGFEYEIRRNLTIGARGIYRAQGSVIEDGSFDDGDTYFLFNPGESQTEQLACANPAVGCFGRARRYYRALEFTATKRFSNNYQFLASYVYSSLIGNYEGLFRNDNGQADPNITSLFDLVSLLANAYGRLPNDRPHQFKLDGSYTFKFGLVASTSFRAQSGIPVNQLIPHVVYGNNEGFGVPRGSAGRTPTNTNMDLGVYYPIKFGEGKQLRLQLDWFNFYNSQRAIRVDDTFQINSGTAGVPPVSNPFYNTGTIFQFPSSLRLGVKFQF
ncbi:MAG TPA: TonB-dependent receptor [Blastocatellia bacterium]|nr:TonB-dependent receptor [Blastocatellia bacterium]